jgi:glycosyltransferase involved in cell wall biosynthesis
MIINIIIAVKNDSNNLRSTLDSISNQEYDKINLIIMNGGNDLETDQIIKEYNYLISVYRKESDNGVYYAWNKALCFIENGWVHFLGAGDVYPNNRTLLNIVNLLQVSGDSYKFAYGNLVFNYKKCKTYKRHSNHLGLGTWENGRPWTPKHTETLTNSDVFKNITFVEDYRLASDLDFMLKVFESYPALYIPIDIIVMDVNDGVSVNINNYEEANSEIKKILCQLKIYPPLNVWLLNTLKVKLKLCIIKFAPKAATKKVFNFFRFLKNEPPYY